MKPNHNPSPSPADKRVFVQPDDRPLFERVTRVKGWSDTRAFSRMLRNFVATDPELRELEPTNN